MLADDDDDDAEEEEEAEEEDDRVLNFHIFFWLRADCYQRWAVNWWFWYVLVGVEEYRGCQAITITIGLANKMLVDDDASQEASTWKPTAMATI